MSELIDRTATVKQICKIAHELCGHDENVLISIALFIQDDKKSFPTVERPHGEWKRTDNRWGVGTWRCTHCDSYYDVDTNYCPTCGASMRKEGETE